MKGSFTVYYSRGNGKVFSHGTPLSAAEANQMVRQFINDGWNSWSIDKSAEDS